MVQTPKTQKLHSKTPSVELDHHGLRDALWFATRLRERAQARIVDSFRAHLAGGPEPADEDLAIFAKLAAEEQRLTDLRDAPAQADAQQPVESQASRQRPAWHQRARGWLDAVVAVRSRIAPTDAGASIAKALGSRRAPPKAVIPATWRTAAWSAAAVCSLFAAFGLWYPLTIGSGATASPVASTSDSGSTLGPPPGATALPSVSVASTPTTVTPVVIPTQLASMRFDDNAPPEEPVALKPPGTKAPVAAAQTTRSTYARQAPQTTAVRWSTSDPIGACRTMNFFARAICMNNSCALRQNARHASCAPVVAQRRLDEARRNLTMMN